MIELDIRQYLQEHDGAMFFTLSKIAWFFINPGNLLLILLVAAFFMMGVSSRPKLVRAGRFILGLVIVSFVAVTILPVGRWLLTPLETRFTADALPEQVDGVIVLGGVLDEEISEAREQAALNGSAERLVALVRLAQDFPDARIVYSGGSGRLVQSERGEAEIVEQLLYDLGVIDKPARFVFENASRNTYENAVESFSHVKPEKNQTWLLVTSARHMPRAMGVFRQVGWPGLVAVPVDYQTAGNSLRGERALAEGLQLVTIAVKEWVGLLAYYATGRTNALFPAQ